MKKMKVKIILASLVLFAGGHYLFAGLQSQQQQMTIVDTGTYLIMTGIARHTVDSADPTEFMGCIITTYPASQGGMHSLGCTFRDAAGVYHYGNSYDNTINKGIYSFRPDDLIRVVVEKSTNTIVAFQIGRSSQFLP